MSINKLPNVKDHWVKDGYLTIKLKTEDYIRLNFNDVEALKKQLTLTDVVKSLPQDNYCNVCNLPTDGEKCYSKRCPV